MNSCQVHNLIDFKLAEEKNRIKSDRIEVKDEVQEAMDEAAAVLPMVLTPKMIWKIIKQVSIMIIWHGYL